MTDSGLRFEMAEFKRGLSEALTKVLQHLAAEPGDNWWKDVLASKELLLAVRGGYLNAYVKGQSVFKIGSESQSGIDGKGQPQVSIHYKYLIEPELKDGSPYIPFNGEIFSIDPAKVVQTNYQPGVTLQRLVKTAARFSGSEKAGVHRIAANEPRVVDLEIAFTRSGDAGEKPTAPRMDLAVLTPGKSKEARLVFCEAKCADNVELWKPEKGHSSEEPRIAVVSQIAKYEKFIRDNDTAIVKAYTRVCKTLIDLSEQRGTRPDPLIEDVAKGAPLTIHPNVHLLIYDFDADKKKGALQKRCDKLSGILRHRVIAKGNPGSFSLSKDILRREAAAQK
jgi:hypothetical protein